MTLAELRDRFDPPHKADGKGGWFVRCPIHADCTTRGNPSLHLSADATGKLLVHCFAGCDKDRILSARGVTLAQLMPPKPTGRSSLNIVATYAYRDETGALLFEVVRLEPKDFRQRRPDPARPGKYLWNLEGVRRVCYRLPELRKQRRVVVVEGEKDADRLWSLGIPATTNAGGAKKWALHAVDYFDQLARALVQELVVIPDADEPGRAHARQIVRGALEFSAFAAVRYLELPGLPPKGDTSDFLALTRCAQCPEGVSG